MTNETETAPEQELQIGHVQWHCSEEGGGPDVGVLLRLDASRHLWAGEITKARWADAGPDAAALGDDFGWWAILYEEDGGKATVLGRFVDQYTATDFIDKLAGAIRPAAPTGTVGEVDATSPIGERADELWQSLLPVMQVGEGDAYENKVQALTLIINALQPTTVSGVGEEGRWKAPQRAAPDAPQCCMCGRLGLSTVEGDGGTECQLEDGRWTCSLQCWDLASAIYGFRTLTPPSPGIGGAVSVEPVAWQQRNLRADGTPWGDWYPSTKDAYDEQMAQPLPRFEVRALYLSPPSYGEVIEAAAKWHEAQAEALEGVIESIKRDGLWVDPVRRATAELHRKSAAAIRALPQPIGRQ